MKQREVWIKSQVQCSFHWSWVMTETYEDEYCLPNGLNMCVPNKYASEAWISVDLDCQGQQILVHILMNAECIHPQRKHTTWRYSHSDYIILLMEEILHHLGCIKLQQKMCLLVLVRIFGEFTGKTDRISWFVLLFSLLGESRWQKKAAPSRGSYEPGKPRVPKLVLFGRFLSFKLLKKWLLKA